jgi:hypothetical protein
VTTAGTETATFQLVGQCHNQLRHRLSHVIHFTELLVKAKRYAVAQLVDALRYKPEDRGFDSRWNHWNFSVT